MGEKHVTLWHIQNYLRTVIERKMKFIEVTDYDRDVKYLVSVDKITTVACDKKGTVFIETGTDLDGESSGLFIAESFDEIKNQINSEN